MELIFTQGISASGKTTWAEQFVKDNPTYTNINRDDIRWELWTNGVPDWSAYKFSKAKEKAVTLRQTELIEEACYKGLNMIISNTNLNPKYITAISKMECLSDYTVSVRQFDIDFVEALTRDARRTNGVGYKTIARQYGQYMQIKYGDQYHKHIEGKPSAFICDLDGTICDMKGLRSPFEWDKVSLDRPKKGIIDMVRGLIDRGYEPIFVSGRDSICSEATDAWIRDHVGVDQFYLFMRPEGSFEKDTKVKKDIFNKYIRHNFNVEVVLDDRPTVSRMFRYELGLNVVSVADPYIEF